MTFLRVIRHSQEKKNSKDRPRIRERQSPIGDKIKGSNLSFSSGIHHFNIQHFHKNGKTGRQLASPKSTNAVT